MAPSRAFVGDKPGLALAEEVASSDQRPTALGLVVAEILAGFEGGHLMFWLSRLYKPDALYKYVVKDRWDVVENFSIRFTQFADLNDPSEIHHADITDLFALASGTANTRQEALGNHTVRMWRGQPERGSEGS